MQTCPKCTYQNRDGVLICERCRQSLHTGAVLPTRQMDRVFDYAVATEFPALAAQEMADGTVTLHLLESSDSLVLDIEDRVVLGRVGPHTTREPDVDLSPYDAFRKGVSSQHAALYRVDGYIKISDMGSLNGTYLNREGLIANAGYSLYSGDLIHLGQLAIQVLF